MVDLNLAQKLLSLSGEPLLDENGKEAYLGRVIANLLVNNPSADNKDLLRLFSLGKTFYESKKITTLDGETVNFVIGYIEKAQGIPLVKGQIIGLLKSA